MPAVPIEEEEECPSQCVPMCAHKNKVHEFNLPFPQEIEIGFHVSRLVIFSASFVPSSFGPVSFHFAEFVDGNIMKYSRTVAGQHKSCWL